MCCARTSSITTAPGHLAWPKTHRSRGVSRPCAAFGRCRSSADCTIVTSESASDSDKCRPRLPCIRLDMFAPYLREARRHLHGSSRLKLVVGNRNDRAKATDPHPQDFAPLAGSWLRCLKRLNEEVSCTMAYVHAIPRSAAQRNKAAEGRPAYGVHKLPLALAY
jgi:hypothetical protein